MTDKNTFNITINKCSDCPKYNSGEFWHSKDYCEDDNSVQVSDTGVPDNCPLLKETRRIDNSKKNSCSVEELEAFASSIADGLDLNNLLASYEQDIFDRLYSLTDEELIKEKDFYAYDDKL